MKPSLSLDLRDTSIIKDIQIRLNLMDLPMSNMILLKIVKLESLLLLLTQLSLIKEEENSFKRN